MNLMELATKLNRVRESKKDYIVNTKAVVFQHPEGGRIALDIAGEGVFDATNHALDQIVDFAGVPRKFAQRIMSEQPQLFQNTLNTLVQASSQNKMIRTLEGNARAFLSDRYRRIDNFEVADAILPILADSSVYEIKEAEVTEQKLYIKAIVPSMRKDVKVGDTVEAGVMITNSEIGLGACQVQPFVNRLVCSNGMVIADARIRKLHLGAQLSGGQDGWRAEELYSDETKAQTDKAILMQLRDGVWQMSQQETFDKIVDMFTASTATRPMENTIKGAELIAQEFELSKKEHDSFLGNLLRGNDETKWGAANAMTALAHNARSENYDRATRLEEFGFSIIKMPAARWTEVALAN